jgi:hypothetical protein
MKLPVDTSGMTFMCATAPAPVLDFEIKRPRADENGEVLYAVQIVALAQGSAEVINVKVAGEPRVAQGTMLSVHELVATPWSMGDRSGVSFRASRIEPVASGRGSARAEAA